MKFLILMMGAVLITTSVSAKVILGKIDISKVLTSVNQGLAVRDQLKKSFDEKQKVLKDEEDKIRKLQDDYQKKATVLNEKERVKKEREIQEKIAALQQKGAGFQKDIQDLEQKLKIPILDNVKGVVTEVSKSSDVDFTYEAGMTPILYAKEEKDLTDDIIKLYNKKFPK